VKAVINETKFRVILSIVRAAVLALQMAAMAAGQGNFPSKLDLESAVARAMEHDPQLKAARTESKVASERVKEARSGRMPTVQFVFGSLLEQGRFAASNL
jgi:outer membrane protein TolC